MNKSYVAHLPLILGTAIELGLVVNDTGVTLLLENHPRTVRIYQAKVHGLSVYVELNKWQDASGAWMQVYVREPVRFGDGEFHVKIFEVECRNGILKVQTYLGG